MCGEALMFSCPPGDDNFRIATPDRLRSQMCRLQPAAADLANGHARYALRQPGTNQRLPCRVLADTGGQHLTHDDFGNLLRLYTGARQQRFDDVGTKIGRRHFADGAIELTDCGAQRCGDNYFVHTDIPISKIYFQSPPVRLLCQANGSPNPQA
jgi:hypothetical protein